MSLTDPKGGTGAPAHPAVPGTNKREILIAALLQGTLTEIGARNLRDLLTKELALRKLDGKAFTAADLEEMTLKQFGIEFPEVTCPACGKTLVLTFQWGLCCSRLSGGCGAVGVDCGPRTRIEHPLPRGDELAEYADDLALLYRR